MCDLATMVHNKWFHYSGNKMICLYGATMDDMIHVLMNIANDMSWLKRGSTNKGPILVPLKMRVAIICEDRKLLANAVKSYRGTRILALGIVPWRAHSCLGLPNRSWTCHMVLIVTHIGLTKFITPFLTLTLCLKVMHRDFGKMWCGSYPHLFWTWIALPFNGTLQCCPQLNQNMLGNASTNRFVMQCKS